MHVSKKAWLVIRKILAFFKFNEDIMLKWDEGFLKSRNRLKKYGLSLKIKGLSITCTTGHSGIIEEQFIQRNTDIISKGDIIDCGANIGIFALYCSTKSSEKIFCIEPDLHNLELLKKNIKDNKVNATVILYAAGDKNKPVIFSSTTIGVGSHVPESRVKKIDEELVKAEMRTLDYIADKYKIKPGFVKIDVEGYELKVLAGAKKTLSKYHPVLLIEVHKAGFYPGIKSCLKKLGYSKFEAKFGDSLLCR